MAEINKNVKIEFTATITLTEIELAALEALTAYGTKAFLNVFSEKLGTSAIGPFQKGIETLFQTISNDVSPTLSQIKGMRNIIRDQING